VLERIDPRIRCGPHAIGYALFHGIRADLLRRLGDPEAQREYARAAELATNEAERAFYRARQGTFGAESP